MREIFYIWKDVKCLKRMLISGMLFLILAIPFKVLFSLVPGMTEVRPANMIPPVLGLIWGPAAAWGIAAANAVSDILVSQSGFSVWFPGMIINFFFAYLPYKLWYSFGFRGKPAPRPSLSSVSEILRFISVCLVSSLATTVLLAMLFEALGFQAYTDSALLLFFNNFDFTIVLGIPAVLLMSNSRRTSIWIPREALSPERREEDPAARSRSQLRFYLLLLVICGMGLLYYLMGQSAGWVMPAGLEWALITLFLLFEAALLFQPMNPMEENQGNIEIRTMSIRAKVILGFLLVSMFFILNIGIVTYVSQRDVVATPRDLWQYIYTVVGVSLNIMCVVSVLFLKYVEMNITEPLEFLSQMVRNFAAQDHQSVTEADYRELAGRSAAMHTGDEIEGLYRDFNRMMDDIHSYVINLTAVTAEKERIGAELSVATQIQASMLPCIFPPYPDRKEFEIYATMTPAKEVGGDFYDFFLVDDDHLALVIADVSGKGVPAALFMVITKVLLMNSVQSGKSAGEVLEEVNRQLCVNNTADMFVTVWLGILDIPSGRMICANAGHEYPALRRAGGSYELLKDRHGFVLAGMEGSRYRQYELCLAPGDELFVYTDGVAEATSRVNELYGTGRMLAALNSCPFSGPEPLLRWLKLEIDAFVGEAPQFDDITMLAFRYSGLDERGVK